MPPPFGLIAEARDLARAFFAHSGKRQGDDAEVLMEAARAIWKGCSVLESAPPRKKPGAARTMRSIRRAIGQP